MEEKTIQKLRVIAASKYRTANGQIRFMVFKLIEDFEKENGPIQLETNTENTES